jgi:anhydro-N-acetylmuramic acid kinase
LGGEAKNPPAGWLIGLMSGTSADGIDAALLWSDGEAEVRPGPILCRSYDAEFRARLMSCYGGKGPVADVERELTERHAHCAAELLTLAGKSAPDILAIGFHGQTILHRPEAGRTWQIGDGALLAELTGIDVVNNFRSADVAAGGQGAPLVPVFHRAIAGGLARPVAFLNIGGVANVTWIGADDELLAYDTGPGNALIDDWVMRHAGVPYDRDGAIAMAGAMSSIALGEMLQHPYFKAPAPKSLDRNDFYKHAMAQVSGLSLADGAMTLTAFTVETVAMAAALFPKPVKTWILCGGGRRNPVLTRMLAGRLESPTRNVDDIGWDGDGLEAMAFAYLAMRSIRGLPISFPGSTGVARPQTGGKLHRFNSR